ncbi:MAG: hypothetical protein K2W81_08145 [Sphingomonas sp.]|uniref:hypothetical protein n=1 Tax=Sphingomonas sp. TaxID=28214 RepID=UPI0025D079FC|nr:hypothetical protein [Sphingomonas sp.]MBY0283920.1 hypothetical protein [Sphingomonas sp.]
MSATFLANKVAFYRSPNFLLRLKKYPAKNPTHDSPGNTNRPNGMYSSYPAAATVPINITKAIETSVIETLMNMPIFVEIKAEIEETSKIAAIPCQKLNMSATIKAYYTQICQLAG